MSYFCLQSMRNYIVLRQFCTVGTRHMLIDDRQSVFTSQPTVPRCESFVGIHVSLHVTGKKTPVVVPVLHHSHSLISCDSLFLYVYIGTQYIKRTWFMAFMAHGSHIAIPVRLEATSTEPPQRRHLYRSVKCRMTKLFTKINHFHKSQ